MLHFIARLMTTLRPLLFWDVRRRGLVIGYRCFRTAYRSHRSPWRARAKSSPRWKPEISCEGDVPLDPSWVPAELLRQTDRQPDRQTVLFGKVRRLPAALWASVLKNPATVNTRCVIALLHLRYCGFYRMLLLALGHSVIFLLVCV